MSETGKFVNPYEGKPGEPEGYNVDHGTEKPEGWTERFDETGEHNEAGEKRDEARANAGEEDYSGPNDNRNQATFFREHGDVSSAEEADIRADELEELAGSLHDLEVGTPTLFEDLKQEHEDIDFSPEGIVELKKEIATEQAMVDELEAELRVDREALDKRKKIVKLIEQA